MSNPFRRIDVAMLGAIMLLTGLSFLFIYSASSRSSTQALSGLFVRQTVWALLGLAGYAAASVFDYRKLLRLHWWTYAGALAALVLVLLVGTSVYGARRWFSIGGVMVQPSEAAKLAVIFTLAACLGNPATDLKDRTQFLMPFALAGIPFLLIAAEPDLGTALVLVPVGLVLLFCAGAPLRPILILLGIGLAALLVLVAWLVFFPDSLPFLTGYQKTRLMVYLNLVQDPLDAGWNKLQSQIAVASGGWFGKGWMNGTQNILGFLPRTVAPTDFIFSVVAEETGFAGSLALLCLYALLVWRCLHTAVRSRDLFGRLLAAGIGTLLFTHVFVNIAMTAGLLPITGLPLPLMSYGGSFLVSTMTALGLIHSVWLRRRIYK